MSTFVNGKQVAAYHGVDEFLDSTHHNIGIGSGSTIAFAVERIAERLKTENLPIKSCVPTSVQARHLITRHSLPLSDLDQTPVLDITFDGADEIADSILIKGGGGCMTQEKIVASNSKKLIILGDAKKEARFLGDVWKKGLPIEVIQMASRPVQERILAKFGGACVLREAISKAGPVISDNGNFIIDWDFPVGLENGIVENGNAKSSHHLRWKEINEYIRSIPGVVDTGLFIDMATAVVYGEQSGKTRIVTFENSNPFLP